MQNAMLALVISLARKGEILCWNPADQDELVELLLLTVYQGPVNPLWIFL